MSAIISRSQLLLNKVSFKGLKSIEDLETNVKPGLNILIGKNGAGKSNFFEFMSMASSSLFSLNELSFKSAELSFLSEDKTQVVYSITKLNSRQVTDDMPSLTYGQKVKINGKIVYDSQNELSYFSSTGRPLSPPRNIATLFSRLKFNYRRANFIGFGYPDRILGLSEPMTMEIPLDIDDFWDTSGFPLLRAAMEALESRLQEEFDLTLNEDSDPDEKWKDVVEGLDTEKFLKLSVLDEKTLDNLKKFSPIQDVRLSKNVTFYKSDHFVIAENIRMDFFVNDNWLPWSQLSDGTKRLFIIISDISLSFNRLILLEEPELGIHPHQFDLVMQFLTEQAVNNQIIISTHSPKALDVLNEDELDRIMIATYQKGRGTQIGHLTERQKEKAIGYINDVGFLSDYWLLSDLES
ncbi:ATP-binding protein [Pedobacter sp. BG31]|uniref:ATP-binding protein n=1 Tax=Pedobacter sp. BG31 TaxID=3349697 RepID=UPI0035F45320